MSDVAPHNPTGRFSGLARVYARHRPDYPVAALDFILGHCGLGPGAVLVDVGSGTGISSRQFASRGLRVIGIEPNADMRTTAEAESPGGTASPVYCDGRAEATGLDDDCCAAVLAAQAFHWFASAATLREFRRVLQPGGWVVLLANERDESDPFTAAVGAVFRTVRETATVEGMRARTEEVLLASPLFREGRTVRFPHGQQLDEEGLLGRAFSASYAPRAPAAAEAFAAGLRAAFGRFQEGGHVVLKYVTSVTAARK